jgi:hypothetical protein
MHLLLAQVESEYWTMSVMGVTRVTTDGPKEGEYMELGEWIRWVRHV